MYPQKETSPRSVDYCVVHSPKIYGHPKTERQINSHDTDGFDLKDFLCISSVCPWVDKLLKDLLNQLNGGGRLKIQCCDHCQCAQKSLRPGTKAVFRDLPVGDYWRRRKWSIKKLIERNKFAVIVSIHNGPRMDRQMMMIIQARIR